MVGILLAVTSLSAHPGPHGGTGFLKLSLHLLADHWGLALIFGLGIFYLFYTNYRKRKGTQE